LQIEFAGDVQRQAEQSGQEVSGEQIWDIFNSRYIAVDGPLRLGPFEMRRSTHDEIQAQLFEHGQLNHIDGKGHGIIDAFVNALAQHSGVNLKVLEYSEHALQHRSDGEAVAYVQVSIGQRRYAGVAVHEDIVTASLNAVLSAYNRALEVESADQEGQSRSA